MRKIHVNVNVNKSLKNSKMICLFKKNEIFAT